MSVRLQAASRKPASPQLVLFAGAGTAVAPCADVFWTDVCETQPGRVCLAQERTMGRPQRVGVWMGGLGDLPGLSASLPAFNCI